ncbi:response regulator [Achromobacter sp. GbtcB20]|uniref:response regulator n=1 Tax=Achromobacter sp. GbtcB20 TaxID=2824765 RepID=UPI00126692BA|nr:response regulator [Achromobacter sp. GbtcB20]
MTDAELTQAGATYTILVVDDNDTARWLLGEMLAAEGYVVLEANCADEAIAILERSPEVRAVVTDIEMPGLIDGLELARRIVAGLPGVAVLLTSGRHQPALDGLPHATRFMPKPYGYGELLAHLEILIPRS